MGQKGCNSCFCITEIQKQTPQPILQREGGKNLYYYCYWFSILFFISNKHLEQRIQLKHFSMLHEQLKIITSRYIFKHPLHQSIRVPLEQENHFFLYTSLLVFFFFFWAIRSICFEWLRFHAICTFNTLWHQHNLNRISTIQMSQIRNQSLRVN